MRKFMMCRDKGLEYLQCTMKVSYYHGERRALIKEPDWEGPT